MGLVQIIVFISVILIALITAKIFNIIHGFITLVGLSVALYFIYFLMNKAGHINADYEQAIAIVIGHLIVPYTYIIDFFKLHFMSNPYEWNFYIIPLGIWIISFVLAVFFRRITHRNR